MVTKTSAYRQLGYEYVSTKQVVITYDPNTLPPPIDGETPVLIWDNNVTSVDTISSNMPIPGNSEAHGG